MKRYSGILEPNLYYNPVLVPGVTCTDKYQIGPAGQIYVHKLTTSAVESGTPGRDFLGYRRIGYLNPDSAE